MQHDFMAAAVYFFRQAAGKLHMRQNRIGKRGLKIKKGLYPLDIKAHIIKNKGYARRGRLAASAVKGPGKGLQQRPVPAQAPAVNRAERIKKSRRDMRRLVVAHEQQ